MSTSWTPGKIILFGEHSVVYPPHAAIIATIDLGCGCKSQTSPTTQAIDFVDLKNSKYSSIFDIEDITSRTSEFKKLHSIAVEKNDWSDFLKIFKSSHHNSARAIIGLAIEKIKELNGEIQPMRLELDCNIPFGSGFGSSAAISVSIIANILDFHKIQFTKQELFDVVFEFEKFQHGNPSGADLAAVIYGGITKFSKDTNNQKKIEHLEVKNLDKALIIHTGNPNESTGEMVEIVRKNFNKDTSTVRSYFDEIDNVIGEFLNNEDLSESEFKNLLNTNGVILEKLGVVSDIGLEISRQIRNEGGGIKICGAGGLANACGAMIVSHDDPDFVFEIAKKFNCKCFEVKLGEKGFVNTIDKSNL